MPEQLACVGCGRIIKINKYKGPAPYRCSKCRGIEIPKVHKARVPEERGLHIK